LSEIGALSLERFYIRWYGRIDLGTWNTKKQNRRLVMELLVDLLVKKPENA
jgi:hypothetical protein